MKIITSSWDDGHPSDFRLAELLQKYQLKGTFYIPQTNPEHEVMTEQEILQLDERFEIGGHTVNHTIIDRRSKDLFETEIKGCYNWIKDLTGAYPLSFCFPRGIYNNTAVEYCIDLGFKVIRTTELLNPKGYTSNGLFPTTLQMYPHSSLTYCKHLLKRFKFESLGLYLQSGWTSNLLELSEYYLDHISKNGGCFHLWGHSWELDEFNLWDDLEGVLKTIANNSEFSYISNSELVVPPKQ